MAQLQYKRLAGGLIVLLMLVGCTPTVQDNPSTTITTVVTTDTGGTTVTSADTTTSNVSTASKTSTTTNSSQGSKITTTVSSVEATITTKYQVTPSYTVEMSAQLFNNKSVGAVNTINMQRVVIQPFDSEWAFNHISELYEVGDGLICVWGSGRVHEDDCGQRIMISRSSDGLNWSDPEVFVDSQQGLISELVLNGLGFFSVDKNTVNFYYGSFEYSPNCLSATNTRPDENTTVELLGDRKDWVITSNDGGKTWSEPTRLYNLLLWTRIYQSNTGRILFPSTGGRIYYTDDPTGLSGFQHGNIDTSQYTEFVKNTSNGYCGEPGIYKAPDGTLRMWYRTKVGRLAISESYDDGETWTDIYLTKFTDGSNRCYIGQLPDGRYYYVGTPVAGSNRTPLMLCISEDGFNFSKQYILGNENTGVQQAGIGKVGQYGYPTALVKGDYLYITYSVCKESIEVLRIALADI